ncbi:MAG TPA: AIR synthase-related protein, partial [Ilumatobacteraceae bacterium]
RLVVRFEGAPVIDLETAFLHDGRPRRRLAAVLPAPVRSRATVPCPDPRAALLALLAHPNIASKAPVIRRYDHEILGATVVRPLVGVHHDGPGDGVVLAAPTDSDGIAIGIGVNPWYGIQDPERMAWAVIDEAIRNVVVAGGDPSRVALMDNFSWGNPTRPTTFGALVAAVRGCCDAAHHYRAPFVSGKDSLNNEYLATDGNRHAIPPTLVITAVAAVDDAALVVTPDLKAAGNLLVLLGRTLAEFGGSHLTMVLQGPEQPSAVPSPDPGAAWRYRMLHEAIGDGLVAAAHDCSEGGIAVALAEMAIGGRLGVEVDLSTVDDDPVTALFSESVGRIICEVRPEHLAAFKEHLGAEATLIGHATAAATMSVAGQFTVPVQELVTAFTGGHA